MIDCKISSCSLRENRPTSQAGPPASQRLQGGPGVQTGEDHRHHKDYSSGWDGRVRRVSSLVNLMLSPVPNLMPLLDILTFSLVLIGCCLLFQLLLQRLWLCSERLHQLPGSHQREETWVHIGEVTVMINKLSYYTCECVCNTVCVCVCVCEQIRGTWGCRCE